MQRKTGIPLPTLGDFRTYFVYKYGNGIIHLVCYHKVF